jgi:hypothetical protein
MMVFKFADGDTVVLKEDRPHLGLKAGAIGIVDALYATRPPAYEVTFRLPGGQEFGMVTFEDELDGPST